MSNRNIVYNDNKKKVTEACKYMNNPQDVYICFQFMVRSLSTWCTEYMIHIFMGWGKRKLFSVWQDKEDKDCAITVSVLYLSCVSDQTRG